MRRLASGRPTRLSSCRRACALPAAVRVRRGKGGGRAWPRPGDVRSGRGVHHLVLDREHRAQIGVRVLEDHAHLPAPGSCCSATCPCRNTLRPSMRTSPPAMLTAGQGQQAEHRERRHRLTRPGLADQADDLVPLESEVDALQDPTAVPSKVEKSTRRSSISRNWRGRSLHQALDRGSKTSRSPVAEQAEAEHREGHREAGEGRFPPTLGRNSRPDAIISPHSGVAGFRPR